MAAQIISQASTMAAAAQLKVISCSDSCSSTDAIIVAIATVVITLPVSKSIDVISGGGITNEVADENISEEQYARVLKMWERLSMNMLCDYT